MFITFVVIETDIETGGTICLIFKFFGESFGITSGVIGIYLSRSKNDKDMKCHWKGFITMVSLKSNYFHTIVAILNLSVQCAFTTVGSFIGFIVNVAVLHGSYLDPYYFDDRSNKRISAELSLVQILSIETFLFFGKT